MMDEAKVEMAEEAKEENMFIFSMKVRRRWTGRGEEVLHHFLTEQPRLYQSVVLGLICGGFPPFMISSSIHKMSKISFWPFYGFIDRTAEDMTEKRGRERESDTQQRDPGWTRMEKRIKG